MIDITKLDQAERSILLNDLQAINGQEEEIEYKIRLENAKVEVKGLGPKKTETKTISFSIKYFLDFDFNHFAAWQSEILEAEGAKPEDVYDYLMKHADFYPDYDPPGPILEDCENINQFEKLTLSFIKKCKQKKYNFVLNVTSVIVADDNEVKLESVKLSSDKSLSKEEREHFSIGIGYLFEEICDPFEYFFPEFEFYEDRVSVIADRFNVKIGDLL
jgi:hypothetical protein